MLNQIKDHVINLFCDASEINIEDAIIYDGQKLVIILSKKDYMASFEILSNLEYDFLVVNSNDETIAIAKSKKFSNIDELLLEISEDRNLFVTPAAPKVSETSTAPIPTAVNIPNTDIKKTTSAPSYSPPLKREPRKADTNDLLNACFLYKNGKRTLTEFKEWLETALLPDEYKDTLEIERHNACNELEIIIHSYPESDYGKYGEEVADKLTRAALLEQKRLALKRK